MDQETLKEILEKHGRWLRDEEEAAKADLRGANLRDADLTDAYLRGADLRGADLRGANLTDANLTDANLRGANLGDANLRGADLIGANLADANLTGADLRGANLIGANLTGANLRGADLTGANLTDAYLTDAYLRGADLRGANLDPEWLESLAWEVCPAEGSFIGYKKVKGDAILTLEIPAEPKRSTGFFERKCRASKAKVLSAELIDGTPITDSFVFYSYWDAAFQYTIGETVSVDDFDESVPPKTCAQGCIFI